MFLNLLITIHFISKIKNYNISLANQITAGQLLCGGLFSADSLSNWFAAVAMLHAIQDNGTQKEQLLRVQLATSIGSPPVSLLQQCCNILAQVSLRLNQRQWMHVCMANILFFRTTKFILSKFTCMLSWSWRSWIISCKFSLIYSLKKGLPCVLEFHCLIVLMYGRSKFHEIPCKITWFQGIYMYVTYI